MSKSRTAAAGKGKARPRKGRDETPPKHQYSHHSRAARVSSIAAALSIKDLDLAFLCGRDGTIPVGKAHGLGLYYHDCRFLNGYELRLADARPQVLVASAREGFGAVLELTNRDFRTSDGGTVGKESVGVRWERVLDAHQTALYDRFTLRNYRLTPVSVPLSLHFASAFEDIFVVRGMPAKSRGKLHRPAWHGDALVFRYDGSDGVKRTLTVRFDPAPDRRDGATAHFTVELPARQNRPIAVWLQAAEEQPDGPVPPKKTEPPDFAKTKRELDEAYSEWLGHQTRVTFDDEMLSRTVDRSLRDLRALLSRLRNQLFFAAGSPWYDTLFGRDSIIASLQSLAFEPQVAEQTLRLLASFQGAKTDHARDEQPGKIMHELRVGELARNHEIPQTPYYGTVDATPLFLVLLARHAEWTGRLDLFQELRGNVERALEWMDRYGDPEGWGYLTYHCESSSTVGLGNQGWKDSGDAIVNADGSLARPPIALAEVQGYAYLAKLGLAGLYRRAGAVDRAAQLEREGGELRERFNRDFWVEEKGVFALALQKDRQPAAVVASNAGQVLWSGIAEPDKARRTMDRLMRDDVFNGWGVRTLSAAEVRYDPVKYHLGTVWPHDNSIILAGFRNYGGDAASRRTFKGITDAATFFRYHRLPEVFAGFGHEEYDIPVHYPVACHPQAWAAGAVPFMIQTMLGLVPDGFGRKLRVVRPILPDGINSVDVQGLPVGDARVDLRFERGKNGSPLVRVRKTDGSLDIEVQGADKV